MTAWYVHREQGAIASTHSEIQEGYAEELLEDSDAELSVYLDALQKSAARITISRLRFMLVTSATPARIGGANLYADIRTVCQADPDPMTIIYLDNATDFESDHPKVLKMAAVLGMNAEQVHALFEQGRGIDA